MYSKIIKVLQENIENPKALFNVESCPDKTWTFIKYSEGEFFECPQPVCESILGKIILILESPHIDEYKTLDNIAPAKGKTGRNLNNGLINFLVLTDYHKNCFKPGLYEVVIMNAVQYQTSLGLATDEYRTFVFQLAWFLFAREDFIKRLGNHLSNFEENSLVFNACTKGNSLKVNQARKLAGRFRLSDNIRSFLVFDKKKINLNKLVGTAIKDAGFNAYSSSHPVVWDKMIS